MLLSIKQMLRRITSDRPKDWDRFLSPLLFAIRDSPQESLQFSPFELICGHSVRGPMTILKDLWTRDIPDEEVKITYQYVIDLQFRLEDTCRLAQQNLGKASIRYRNIYNRRSKRKNLKIGDKVLVLLPTKTNKLLLQWKGPYTVVETVGNLDYRIQMDRKMITFYANILKEYFDREFSDTVSVIYLSLVMTVMLMWMIWRKEDWWKLH